MVRWYLKVCMGEVGVSFFMGPKFFLKSTLYLRMGPKVKNYYGEHLYGRMGPKSIFPEKWN